jgi:hypothetical protein
MTTHQERVNRLLAMGQEKPRFGRSYASRLVRDF